MHPSAATVVGLPVQIWEITHVLEACFPDYRRGPAPRPATAQTTPTTTTTQTTTTETQPATTTTAAPTTQTTTTQTQPANPGQPTTTQSTTTQTQPPAAPGDPATTTTQTTTTETKAEGVTLATEADIKVGTKVYDQSGAEVGKVDSVSAKGAIVSTGKARAEIPLSSFGKNDKGLVVSLTKAELDSQAKAGTTTKTKTKTKTETKTEKSN